MAEKLLFLLKLLRNSFHILIKIFNFDWVILPCSIGIHGTLHEVTFFEFKVTSKLLIWIPLFVCFHTTTSLSQPEAFYGLIAPFSQVLEPVAPFPARNNEDGSSDTVELTDKTNVIAFVFPYHHVSLNLAWTVYHFLDFPLSHVVLLHLCKPLLGILI